MVVPLVAVALMVMVEATEAKELERENEELRSRSTSSIARRRTEDLERENEDLRRLLRATGIDMNDDIPETIEVETVESESSDDTRRRAEVNGILDAIVLEATLSEASDGNWKKKLLVLGGVVRIVIVIGVCVYYFVPAAGAATAGAATAGAATTCSEGVFAWVERLIYRLLGKKLRSGVIGGTMLGLSLLGPEREKPMRM